nr:MAG TPA: hypothetical protein [Caudoviricetes sp.]
MPLQPPSFLPPFVLEGNFYRFSYIPVIAS